MGIERIRHDLKRIAKMVQLLVDEIDTLEHDCTEVAEKKEKITKGE